MPTQFPQLSPHDLSPYSSHIIARRLTPIPSQRLRYAEIDDVLMKALTVIGGIATQPRAVTGNVKVDGRIVDYELLPSWQSQPGLDNAACHYVEERPVTWLSGQAMDKLNHLLVVTIAADGLMLLTSTDAEHRAALLLHLQQNFFYGWEAVSQAVLVKAMVERFAMRTLWLAGIHRDTAIKPSSKILSGSSLAEAIDPMNDSSFLAGAVRSSEGGVSLRNSSVWTGPNDTMRSFEARSIKLLSAVRAAIAASPPDDLPVHSSLARWITSMDDTADCYFIAHVDPETLDGASGRHKAQELVNAFDVQLDQPGAAAGKAAWSFTARVTDAASATSATIDVVPDLAGDGDRVVYVIDPLPPAPFDDWVTAVMESPSLLRAYYNSGHTIASGSVSQMRIQDAPFGKFVFLDFTGYLVTQEKPMLGKGIAAPIQDMTSHTDVSLFKWIFKEGLGLLNLAQPSQGQCWLYCDDGSSEVADFVHLDIGSTPKRLTLFHAKGAGSAEPTRRSVPGPYELVASQAIKNLRAFDAKQLLVRIEKRLADNGTERIWDQPWAVGLQPMPDAAAFKAALEQLGTDYDCEVIIVQPHVRRRDFLPAWPQELPQSATVGAKQMRTLLFSVESTARAVNARFRVVAEAI